MDKAAEDVKSELEVVANKVLEALRVIILDGTDPQIYCAVVLGTATDVHEAIISFGNCEGQTLDALLVGGLRVAGKCEVRSADEEPADAEKV